MATSREWLTQLRQQGRNPEWFRSQSEVLYRDIQRGLQLPGEKSGFMRVFTTAMPLLPMEYRLAHWLDLSRTAVDASYDMRDFKERIDALNAIGSFQLLLNATEEAENAFTTAYELADDIRDNKAQIESVIGYLWLQTRNKTGEFTFQHIPDLLMYHAQDRDTELSARMYQAIGALCNQFAQYDRSAAFSRLAYSYFRTKKDFAEQARTAYSLSSAYRAMGEMETANAMLEHAADLYAKTNYVRQYMVIAYEYGVHYYYAADYPAALQWLQISWAEGQQLDDANQLDRVEHCLGIVMTMFRDRLDEARKHLENALRVAEEEGNQFQIVSIRHSLAFNTARQGDYTTAKNEINYGLQLAAAIEDERKRESLEKPYHELIEMIDNNDPILWE
jgi:tetratricopeptide (TPR) repeat protein